MENSVGVEVWRTVEVWTPVEISVGVEASGGGMEVWYGSQLRCGGVDVSWCE